MSLLRSSATLLLALALVAGCSDDSTGDSSGGGGSGGDTGSGGTPASSSASGMGTDDPYGPCTVDGDCPVAESNCPGSTLTCAPPCADVADCPAVAGAQVECTGGQCGITCSVSVPCPNGMKCLAGITCGW